MTRKHSEAPSSEGAIDRGVLRHISSASTRKQSDQLHNEKSKGVRNYIHKCMRARSHVSICVVDNLLDRLLDTIDTLHLNLNYHLGLIKV
jgi:hypothetical protein